MNYSVSSLITEVRVALDQNMSSTTLASLGDPDTLSLEEIINSKIEDAARAVAVQAPLALLGDVTVQLTGTLTIDTAQRPYAHVELPDDFLRLARFKLDGWPYALYSAEMADTPLYVQAHSSYNVRGTIDRPLVFLSLRGAGKKVLEVFCEGCDTSTLGNDCLYIKKPTISSSQITLGEQVKRPTVYHAAYLVALTIQDKDAAERLLAVSNELLK